MFRARDPIIVVGQLLAAGVGTVLALTLAGWPSSAAEAAWVGLGGAVAGLLVALGIEHVVRLHREAMRLQGIEEQLAAEREMRAEERRLWSYQAALAKAEAAINAVHVKVWGDAFNEAARGQVLPVSAILARLEVEQKARGLDKPLPPLDQWKPPPPGAPPI